MKIQKTDIKVILDCLDYRKKILLKNDNPEEEGLLTHIEMLELNLMRVDSGDYSIEVEDNMRDISMINNVLKDIDSSYYAALKNKYYENGELKKHNVLDKDGNNVLAFPICNTKVKENDKFYEYGLFHSKDNKFILTKREDIEFKVDNRFINVAKMEIIDDNYDIVTDEYFMKFSNKDLIKKIKMYKEVISNIKKKK